MIGIIANPNALRFNIKKLKNLLRKLKQNGLKTDVFFTQRAGDGKKIAERIDGHYRIIAAYGGDGIINEVINGNLKRSALCVLPAGTTNVLAIELYGKPSLNRALNALINGKTKKAYTASINGRKFILMAGAGFDAESVFAVNEKNKKLFGKIEYVLSGVKAYLQKSHCFTIEIERKTLEALWVIVSNSRKYAGNFDISEQTDIFTPILDVFFCPCSNRTAMLPYCNLSLFSGFHAFTPFVKHFCTDKPIKIKGEPHIQIDGDYFSKTNAIIKLGDPIDIVVHEKDKGKH